MIETFIKSGLGWILRRIHIHVHDRAVLHSHYIIEDLDAETGKVVRRQELHRNLFLNEGITLAWQLICGAGGTPFDYAHAYIGVGDSATAAVATQTGLQATTNKYYSPLDSSYPIVSGQTATFRSTFGTDVANFTWNELTIANGGSDAATNLNRLVQSMGTKTSAVARIVTATLTIA
jgi:hypothetical protein